LAKNPKPPGGCLLGTFSQELAYTHPKLRSLCEQRFAEWATAIKHDLDEAKIKYAPKASIDTKSLAEYLIAVLQGSQILAKAKQDKRVFAHNLQHFKQYIKTLFEK
jgi:hypothetical protein